MWYAVLCECVGYWIGSFVTQLSSAHWAIIDWNASVIIVSPSRLVPSSDTKPRRFKFRAANLPPDTYAESFIYRVHTFSSTTRFAKLTSVHIPTSTHPINPMIRIAILSTITVPMMLTSLSSASSVRIFISFAPFVFRSPSAAHPRGWPRWPISAETTRRWWMRACRSLLLRLRSWFTPPFRFARIHGQAAKLLLTAPNHR